MMMMMMMMMMEQFDDEYSALLGTKLPKYRLVPPLKIIGSRAKRNTTDWLNETTPIEYLPPTLNWTAVGWVTAVADQVLLTSLASSRCVELAHPEIFLVTEIAQWGHSRGTTPVGLEWDEVPDKQTVKLVCKCSTFSCIKFKILMRTKQYIDRLVAAKGLNAPTHKHLDRGCRGPPLNRPLQ